MSGFQITITDAGRAALVNAQNNGTVAFVLSEIGVSAQAIAGDLARLTALPNERKRLATMAGDVVADDTLHVTIRDESADAYALRSFGLYASTGVLFAIYSQADPILEKSAAAMLLLAVDARLVALGTANVEFGPAGFTLPPANETIAGVVEIATDGEVDAGLDPWRVITVRTLKRALGALTNFALKDHKHDAADVETGVFHPNRIPELPMSRIGGLIATLADKASALHSHTMAQVSGLGEALAGKAAAVHQHDADSIVSGILAVGRIPALAMDKITGLIAALATKATLGVNANFRDVIAGRNAVDGVYYFGSDANRWLAYSEGRYELIGLGGLMVNGYRAWTAETFNPAFVLPLRPAHDINSPNDCPEGISGGDADLGAGLRGYAFLTHHRAQGGYSAQLALPDTGEEVFIRRRSQGAWQAWHQIHTSASFNPATKANADHPSVTGQIHLTSASAQFRAIGDGESLFLQAGSATSAYGNMVLSGLYGDNLASLRVRFGGALHDILHENNTDLWWPAGEMKFYDSASPPSGARILVANGAAVSRSTYARLYAVIGTRYGAGDGATTFNLPDWRGMFVRGLDNGRGLDPGRTLGSYQDSQNLRHDHGYLFPMGVDNTQAGSGVQGGWFPTGERTSADGGDEARPRNTALLACITY